MVLLAASIAAVAEPGAGMGLSAPPGRGEPLTGRLLRAALRGGFQTSHRCLLVLLVDEGPDKEELLAVLLRSLSLSLAIYQADRCVALIPFARGDQEISEINLLKRLYTAPTLQFSAPLDYFTNGRNEFQMKMLLRMLVRFIK